LFWPFFWLSHTLFETKLDVHTLLAKMTLDEKLAMVQGYGEAYVGNIPANTRLGIPALKLEDGKWSPSFWQTSVRFSALQCASVYAQYIFL
jgi:hypothetical protein